MKSYERLGGAVCSHPDMLTFCHNGNVITSAEYCEIYPYIFSDIRELSQNSRFIFTSDIPKKEYPYDAVFNALTASEYIFYKEDTVSEAIKEYARSCGLKEVPVKQGYPACTTLAFGKSAITADEGMAKALISVGINVTLISNGQISLPPYEYGFIGGACGVDKDTVYFLGNAELHRDYKKIRGAIDSEGYKLVSLSDEPLSDLGRIIFID